MASIQLGQRHEGMEEMERGLALTEHGPGRLILGMMYLGEQSPERALPHLERAVQRMPDVARAWDALAQAQVGLGRMDEAFASAERVQALAPDAPQTDVLLMALASMDGVLRVPPEAARHFTEGSRHASEGRLDEARASFEAALRVAPDFADGHYNLGVVVSQQGDKARAEREFRAAIPGFHPRQAVLQADARNNLAFLLVSRGIKGPEPVALVRAAIATRGERPSYLDTLARACDANGDTACAVESFRKLLAAKDSLPTEVRVHAEARLEALGR
jgi:Tfp pilus assembly protein PilF